MIKHQNNQVLYMCLYVSQHIKIVYFFKARQKIIKTWRKMYNV